MSYTKRKSSLNRRETQTLLKTLKLVTTAGTLSLTLAGWGLLAHLDASRVQAAASQDVAMVAPQSVGTDTASVQSPAKKEEKPVKRINVVQWVQDVAGNSVAVVRDRRGSLWYVMGSDIPRLEQGLAPQFQPQLVGMTTRTRAS
jgi:hypothetical protein